MGFTTQGTLDTINLMEVGKLDTSISRVTKDNLEKVFNMEEGVWLRSNKAKETSNTKASFLKANFKELVF